MKEGNLSDLSDKTEKVILEIFSSQNTWLLINIKGTLYNPKTKQYITKSNLGIIDYVFRKKESYGCSNINYSRYYNILVDLQATSALVTYPFIEKKTDSVIGIIQIEYNAKLSEKIGKLKDNEAMLFNMLEICFVNWICQNRNVLDNIDKCSWSI